MTVTVFLYDLSLSLLINYEDFCYRTVSCRTVSGQVTKIKHACESVVIREGGREGGVGIRQYTHCEKIIIRHSRHNY